MVPAWWAGTDCSCSMGMMRGDWRTEPPKFTAVPITAKDCEGGLAGWVVSSMGVFVWFDAIGLAWRGVNHQRLPVDAIVVM
jgi:hypothetical protein